MSDEGQSPQEAQIEGQIGEKLDGIDPGSPEYMMLTEQLAKEMGFDQHQSYGSPTPEQAEVLDLLKDQPPAPEEAPAVEGEANPAQKKWAYEREDGVVKTFDSETDYLRYKIGADANKWADKFKELESKVEKGDQPSQPNQPQDPKELLFDEAVRKSDEWSPVLDVITKAFERYHGMAAQDQQARFDQQEKLLGELRGQLGESAVRSEYGISRSDEAEILEQQPRAVRDGLANLDPAARLAVIRQLKGKSEAPKEGTPPLPRAVPPQQAHVESSARGEPDRNPEAEFMARFEGMSEKDQLGVLGQLFKSDREGTF